MGSFWRSSLGDVKALPRIHGRQDRDGSKMLGIEQLDLEFSNGERRTYERLISRGLGAVIVVPVRDDNTVLLVREYAVGLPYSHAERLKALHTYQLHCDPGAWRA